MFFYYNSLHFLEANEMQIRPISRKFSIFLPWDIPRTPLKGWLDHSQTPSSGPGVCENPAPVSPGRYSTWTNVLALCFMRCKVRGWISFAVLNLMYLEVLRMNMTGIVVKQCLTLVCLFLYLVNAWHTDTRGIRGKSHWIACMLYTLYL